MEHPKRDAETPQASRVYDSNLQRSTLIKRGIIPAIARSRTKHGSGLSRHAQMVGRTNARLDQL